MQDEDKSVIRFLYVFMSVGLAASALILISGLLISYANLIQAGLFFTLLCVAVLGLLRAGKFAAAKVVLPLFTYLIATLLIFTSDEVSIRDEAVLLYALVVALGGLLLGKRGVVFFGILSLLTVEASVFAEIQGWIVNHITAETTVPATLVTAGVTYGLTFVVTYVLVDLLTKNLVKSRAARQELLAANQELNSIRASLERLVDESARASENARAEAEAARREAELQVWFMRGQAQLADQVRGDLDVHALANNITRYLSQAIGAQCGALFLPEGEALLLTGRYAWSESDATRAGDDLVGAAARTKKILRVGDIPAGAPRIFSALGESVPREMLAAPLETNGEIFGVLEFAALESFAPECETFLARVAESAAVALRTAQTRAEMNRLLRNL